MNVWAKMITALRGGANELGEAILDGQALRVLDQEVREAADELIQSKQALADLLAKQKLAQSRYDEFVQSIKQHEEYARLALEKKQESLALEIAQKIAGFERERNQEQNLLKHFDQSLVDMRTAVSTAEQNIKRLKQQIDTLRATESVQRAQVALAQRFQNGGSKLRTAMDSIDAIKQKQKEREALLQAAEELKCEEEPDPLLKKLAQAGILPEQQDAQDVLERIKKDIDKNKG